MFYVFPFRLSVEPALPAKPAIIPNVKMRPLHWQIMPVHMVEKTIWKDLTDEDVAIDTEEVSELVFACGSHRWAWRRKGRGIRIHGRWKGSRRARALLLLCRVYPIRQNNAKHGAVYDSFCTCVVQ